MILHNAIFYCTDNDEVSRSVSDRLYVLVKQSYLDIHFQYPKEEQ